jgi:hypothetical protein
MGYVEDGAKGDKLSKRCQLSHQPANSAFSRQAQVKYR